MSNRPCVVQHRFSYHDYYTSPTDHEYSVEVPASAQDARTVHVRVSAVGGGTLGRSYEGNHWAYSVTVQGSGQVAHGDCFRIRRSVTHEDAAREIAEFVAAFRFGDAELSGDADDRMYIRLTDFARVAVS